MSVKLYRCRKCKEIMTENDIIILYISGREVKRCPFCGRLGTIKPMKPTRHTHQTPIS